VVILVGHHMTGGRRLLWRLVGVAFVVTALTFVMVRLAGDWDAARDAARSLSPASLLGSFAAALLGLGLTALAWRRILAGLGHVIPVVPAAGVFFVSQLGKYVPGSIWPYLAQARLGRAQDVPGTRSAQAGLTFVLLHLLTGVVVGTPRLLLGDGLDSRFAWALLVIPAVLLLVHPRVTTRLVLLAGRLMRADVTPAAPSWAALAGAAAWLLGAWLLYGLSLTALVAPIDGIEAGDLLWLTSAYALAWSVGFVGAAVLVVAAPAGLGFREAALFATLTGVVGPGAAGLVALLSRVIMTVADVSWALVAGRAAGIRRGETDDRSATPSS